MRSSPLARLAPLAIFAAALIANRRAATSLLIWSDTVHDQSYVDRCLGENLCTLLGTQTSIRGFFHAVAWLDLRTLLQWLGVGPTGLLRVVQAANALATTIVFQLAARLGGLTAGAAAAAVLVFGIGPGVPVDAVHNLSVLPFLGAVLTVACTTVVAAPGIATVVLAALVAAIMANVHIVCALAGVSVAGSALAARRRRWLLAAVAIVVFVVAMVGVAPPSWQQNLLNALGERRASPILATATRPPMEVAWWTLLAGVMCAGSLLTRAPAWTAYRRASLGALAVVVPTLATVLMAPAVGAYGEAKYLVPVHAACATAAGLALGRMAQVLLSPLPTARRAVALASPFVVALAIAGWARLDLVRPDQALTFDEVTAAAHLLRAEHGWDDRHVMHAFSTPARAITLTGLLQLSTAATPSRSDADVAQTAAALIRATDAELSEPLPPSWHVLRRAAGDVTVLVVNRTPLDWRRFELCVAGPDDTERCDPVTWDGFDPRRDAVNALPHMPPAGTHWTGAFRLRVPIRPRAGGSAGAIFMPRSIVCGGRIAAVRGIAGTISGDRRRVTFADGPSGATAAAVELEWSVGAPDCDVMQYDGLPPFIIEGESADVDRLERLFRRRELGTAPAGAS